MKLNVAFLLVAATVAPAAGGKPGCGGSLNEIGKCCEQIYCCSEDCERVCDQWQIKERIIGKCIQGKFEDLMGGRKCGKGTLKESGKYCMQRCNKMGPDAGDRCLANCLELKYYENDPAPVDKQAVDPNHAIVTAPVTKQSKPSKDNPIIIIEKAKHPLEDIADANAPAVKLDCNDGVIGCKDGYNNNIKNNNNKNNNNKNNNNKNNKNKNNKNNNNNEVAPWEHSHTMEKTEMKEKKEKMEKKDNADAHHSLTTENMEKEKTEKMEKSDYWRSGGEPWPIPEYKASHNAKDEGPQE